MAQSSGGDPALAQRMQRLEQNMTQGRAGGGMDPAMADKVRLVHLLLIISDIFSFATTVSGARGGVVTVSRHYSWK